MKNFNKLLLLILIIFINSCRDRNNDILYESFLNPPAEAKPFVRWWWNGNCVEEKEIMRELDVMKAAGIGGVEINPIRMPGRPDRTDIKPLEWISPEWNRAVKTASEKAKQNGMITDLIVGSGWPFGGEFLESGEMAQRVVINHKALTGPLLFTIDKQELISEVPAGYWRGEFADNVSNKILFLKLVPENITSLNDCIDLMATIGADGKIQFDVPSGNFILFVGVWQEGYHRVILGAPGSDGPVLDHLNSIAVQKYLDRLSDALEKEFGEKMGSYLRALFCDSIELAGANWTTDFPEKFFQLCGYRIEPFLPFVFYPPETGYRDKVNYSAEFADTLYRVRYDYNRVLVDMFLGRFTKTFQEWCNQHGTLSRYQAYGSPWLVGISEGYLIPDIPEGNNWLYLDKKRPGFHIWNKYASSSGHIGGKSIISVEAMTNLGGVWKTPLELIKQADDFNFITGITHSVLHGYNYSPPEAGFPGWVRYGTYFSEQNTWWPYFNLWSLYNARISSVLQASKPVAGIAILGPKADVWTDNGLWRVPFHNTPWYCYRLWESFSNCGTTADYINERSLQNAKFKDGELIMGEMNYSVLILADVKSIYQETAKKIKEYVDAGGKVVFINLLPSRSPSLVNSSQNDEAVKQYIAQATESGATPALVMPNPDSDTQLISWTKQLMDTLKFKPFLKILNPDTNLYQIHHKYKDQDIFFFSNQNAEIDVRVMASFNTGGKIPWKWDPETGNRHVFPYGENPREFVISLGPVESLLLVFEKSGKQETKSFPVIDKSRYIAIDSPWKLDFFPHTGRQFNREIAELTDFGSSQDSSLNSFSGIIEYTTTFNLRELNDQILDLGNVQGISEVFINDQSLGTRWYGRHQYKTEGTLASGTNTIKIKLTTTLYNYCRTQKDNSSIRNWLRTEDPEPSGVIGPVRLYEKVQKKNMS